MTSMVIETRLTYDAGKGMDCSYPLGLFNTVMFDGQMIEIERGRYPITLQAGTNGWAQIMDVMGRPITKIIMPTEVTKEYAEHRWWFEGKLYILEIRIDSVNN